MSVRHPLPTASAIHAHHPRRPADWRSLVPTQEDSDDGDTELPDGPPDSSPTAEPTEGSNVKKTWVPRSEQAKASRHTAARAALAEEPRIPRLFTQVEAQVCHCVALLSFPLAWCRRSVTH
jgi:hypothetical protein